MMILPVVGWSLTPLAGRSPQDEAHGSRIGLRLTRDDPYSAQAGYAGREMPITEPDATICLQSAKRFKARLDKSVGNERYAKPLGGWIYECL